MKQYTDRKTTPLKYHKFVCYFRLPLFMLQCVLGIVSCFSTMLPHADVYLWSTTYTLIAFELGLFIYTLVVFIGFIRWKHYAWLLFQISLVLGVVLKLLPFIDMQLLPQQFRPSDVLRAWGELFSYALIGTLIFIYYQKRKLLFSDAAGATEETVYFIKPDKANPSATVRQADTTIPDPTQSFASHEAGVTDEADSWIHPDPMESSARVSHEEPLDNATVLEHTQSFDFHQAECIRAYPDFNFIDEMDNKITGPTFSKLLDSGVDMKTAYEFVHRNNPKNPSTTSSDDDGQTKG